MDEKRGWDFLKNRRAASNFENSAAMFIIVIGIILLLFWFFIFIPCQFSFEKYANIQKNINSSGDVKNIFYKVSYNLADKLGFNTGYELVKGEENTLASNFSEILSKGGNMNKISSWWAVTKICVEHKAGTAWYFIVSLFIGMLAGFWIFIISQLGLIIRNVFAKGGYASRWQTMIAGNAWQIIAIGLAYAILLQVPIVNTFIYIITFEALGLNWFLRSIIIAFYIGLGPSWIEEFIKYRLKLKADKAVIYAKAEGKLQKARLEGM